MSLSLSAFTCPEKLDAENKYTCESCSQAVRAHKQLSLFSAANILVLQLKRFRLGMFGKINKHIDFPHKLNIQVC